MNTPHAQADQFNGLDAMLSDYLASPEIYQASEFWKKLNELNVAWLKEEGLDNFKRTVNNNYFNWMISIRSSTFIKLCRSYINRNKFKPAKFLALATASIPDIDSRTYLHGKIKPNFISRKIYAIYLQIFYDFVQSQDNLGKFKELQEPATGNSMAIVIDGHTISQDLCNSYLEYLYARETLGQKFDDIHNIVEIGSGYGRLGYVFNKFHPGKRYIFADIAPGLFVAQWYWDQVAPGAKIFHYRDFSNFEDVRAEFEQSTICFLLPHQLELLPDGYIDLVINISSLQEMSLAQIKHYYKLIHQKAAYFYTKQWFFWDNPNDKITVPAVVYPTNPEWDLVKARVNPVHPLFFDAVFKLHAQN